MLPLLWVGSVHDVPTQTNPGECAARKVPQAFDHTCAHTIGPCMLSLHTVPYLLSFRVRTLLSNVVCPQLGNQPASSNPGLEQQTKMACPLLEVGTYLQEYCLECKACQSARTVDADRARLAHLQSHLVAAPSGPTPALSSDPY